MKRKSTIAIAAGVLTLAVVLGGAVIYTSINIADSNDGDREVAIGGMGVVNNGGSNLSVPNAAMNPEVLFPGSSMGDVFGDVSGDVSGDNNFILSAEEYNKLMEEQHIMEVKKSEAGQAELMIPSTDKVQSPPAQKPANDEDILFETSDGDAVNPGDLGFVIIQPSGYYPNRVRCDAESMEAAESIAKQISGTVLSCEQGTAVIEITGSVDELLATLEQQGSELHLYRCYF